MAISNILGFYNYFDLILADETNAKFNAKIAKLQCELEEILQQRCEILSDFANYPSNQIEDLIESLSKLYERKSNYGKYYINVFQTVRNTVKLEMEKIRNESNFKKREILLRNFKYNIEILPSEIRDRFKPQIEQVEEFIRQDYMIAQDDISRLIQAKVSKDNFIELSEKMDEYKGDYALIRKLKNSIETKFDELLNAVEKNGVTYDFQTMTNSLTSLNGFFNVFGSEKLERSSCIMKGILFRYVNDIANSNGNEAKAFDLLYKLLKEGFGRNLLSNVMNKDDLHSVEIEFEKETKQLRTTYLVKQIQ